MSDDDPSFGIGDVYGADEQEQVVPAEPVPKKAKSGFGFKLPQFMKREKRPLDKKYSSDMDFEEVYESSRVSESENPMTPASIHTGAALALSAVDVWTDDPPPPGPACHLLEHKPSSNMNFAEAYDKPPAMQFEENPSRERAISLQKDNSPPRKRLTPSKLDRKKSFTQPPLGTLQHKPSTEMNFAEAYDKPPPMQLEENPSRERAASLQRGASLSRKSPSSALRRKGTTPPRKENSPRRKGTIPPRRGNSPPREEFEYSHSVSPPRFLMEDNPSYSGPSFTGDSAPSGEFSFLVNSKAQDMDKDDEYGSRLPTKVKPKVSEKEPEKRSLGTFFNLFRATRKSPSEINRSESATLEKLRSLSPPLENDAPIAAEAPMKENTNTANRHRYKANDPHAPALVAMKETLQVQPTKAIAFAPRSAFERSIELSVEMISDARLLYETASELNKRKSGMKLASLLQSLGDIYKSIACFDEGIECLSEALEVRRAVKSGAQEVASTFTDLGLLFCEAGRFVDAYDCFEQAHTALLAYHENGKHPDVAAALGNMGVCLRGLNQTFDSVNMGEKAVKLMEELCGKKDTNTLQQKVLIALSLMSAGDPALAAHMLTQVMHTIEQQMGYSRDHPWLMLIHHEYNKASRMVDNFPADGGSDE